MPSKTKSIARKRFAEPPDSVREFVAKWTTVSLVELWANAALDEAVSANIRDLRIISRPTPPRTAADQARF